MTTKRLFGGVLLAFAGLLSSVGVVVQELAAQEGEVPLNTAQPVGAPPAGGPATPAVEPGKPAGQPAEPAKPEAAKTTSRPTKPETPPNQDEFKARPDEKGLVRFNFQGQAWLDVLEWLARISNLSLDWQELPADFLNLRTQRAYTVAAVRDLINRHLLDRGFTLLKHGEVLTVVNIKKLDPSLVPRVAPEDLDDRDAHEFVKVSFALESLTAEVATEELKPMLSPNGKLTALKATNRVEALDAVINLREIREVLQHEQSLRGRKRLVREFPLEFTRCGEVIEQLQDLLGLDKKTVAAGPMTPQQQQMEQQQLMQQMQQQQQARGGQPGLPKQTLPVHLVANSRKNSIVAQAPADQMAVIAEAIVLIDVPSSKSQSMLRNMNRTQVHRLATIDPEPVVKLLQELGDLDPTTRLQIDKKNHSIIAYASLADQMTIRTLVKKLDGSDRKFEVIKLRRLSADYVAGSIEFMMGGGEKKKSQSNRFNPYFDFYGMGGGRQNNEEDESKKFRVDADVEHNRLLLWTNPVELEEINHLLVKLGEIPGEGGNLSTLRILDTIPPEDIDKLLERLNRTWPGVGPNPLEIIPSAEADETELPNREPPVRKPRAQKRPPRAQSSADETTTQAPQGLRETSLAAVELPRHLNLTNSKSSVQAAKSNTPSDKTLAQGGRFREEPADLEPDAADGTASPDAEDDSDLQVPEGRKADKSGKRHAAPMAAAAASPIRIGRGPDGRLVISSTDTLALDRLEDLLIEIAPPRKDYKVFKMKYKTTWAYGVTLNLKDYFEEKDKGDQRSGRFFWGWGGGGQQSKDDERRLSKRRPLKFIADSDSNSIVVTGADQNQLNVIQDLIDIYDIPESKDSAAVRKTQLVTLRYSKARIVADAIKDVYRDLLSANDPALQNNQNNKEQKKTPDAMYTYVNNFGNGNDDKKPDAPMKFKGLLSVGVDELSNSLIISASETLLDTVSQTVEALDLAARPTVNRMHVVKVDRNVDVADLQKRLKNLVTRPAQPQQPKQPPQQNQNGQQLPANDSTVIIDNN